jgi:hypothetical protein
MKVVYAVPMSALLLVIPVASQAQRGHDDHPQPPAHGQVPPQDQQRRIDEERQRQSQYQSKLDAQVRAAQARSAQLQQQQRNAQYQQHQQYLAALQAQRQHLQVQRDIAHDPYITTAPAFRYRFNGVTRETNQYGVDVLRQAINLGYQQGFQAGRADRADRAPSNYRASFAYQDANLGYNGSYVAEDDYNYYFREGFQRGYQDGYTSRYRYGTYSNGTASILGNILTGILGLTNIH